MNVQVSFFRSVRLFRLNCTLLALLLLGSNSTTLAQNLRFSERRFTVKNGLAENKVLAATCDDSGVFWFSTGTELNRFDGHSFDVFPIRQHKDSLLIDTEVVHLLKGKDGRLILLFANGNFSQYGLFDPQTGLVQIIDLNNKYPPNTYPLSLYTDQAGGLFILALEEGKVVVFAVLDDFSLQKITDIDDQIGQYSPSPRYVQLFVCHWRNHLFYAEQTGITRYNQLTGERHSVSSWFDETGIPHPFPIGQRLLIFVNGRDQLWAALTEAKVLLIYDSQRGVWVKKANMPRSKHEVIADKAGNLLFLDGGNGSPYPGSVLLYQPDHQRWSDLSACWRSGILFGLVGSDFSRGIYLCTSEGLVHAQLSAPRVSTLCKGVMGDPVFAFTAMRGLAEDAQTGDLFFASEFKGLFRVKAVNGSTLDQKATPFVVKDRQTGLPIRMDRGTRQLITDHEKQLWLSINDGNELLCFDPLTATGYCIEHKKGYMQCFSLDPIRRGFWCSIVQGKSNDLYFFDPKTQHFRAVPLPEEPRIYQRTTLAMHLSPQTGLLWLGTTGGLVVFDPQKGQLAQPPGIQHPLLNSPIFAIHESADGHIWLGTGGAGLLRYNPTNGTLTQLDVSRGLSNNKVAAIMADSSGNLWVATYFGLCYFDVAKQTFIQFFEEDGLSHNEHNRWSACASQRDGRLFFGTIDGVTAFHPTDLLGRWPSNVPPRILPFEFTWNHHTQLLGLANISTITLPAAQRACAFRFALSDFDNPENVRFAWRLDGMDDDWHYTDADGLLSFGWLPAGRFRLRVKAANASGQWSEEYHLNLHVEEFFYKTGLFTFFVAILALGLLYWLFHQRQKRLAKEQEAERLRKLDAEKTRLYANITHEFRTPLTLILGHVALGMEEPAPPKSRLSSIRTAGEHLLGLVNQILDLRKVEAGQMQPDWQPVEVVGVLRVLVESMRSWADARDLQLEWNSDVPQLWTESDPDKLRSMVQNLLSNALKFTPPGGVVRVNLSLDQAHRQLRIEVSDTGSGIDAADLPHVFDRFFSTKNDHSMGSTGIGLALVREFATLLGGSVSVESELGRGTSFWVRLPLRAVPPTPQEGYFFKKNATPDAPPAPSEAELTALPPFLPDAADQVLPLVLLVEDNAEIARFVSDILQKNYRVEHAENGEIGLQKALELVPDLILSDVMMPRMDGFGLLERLKTETVTSHIPVVLLTARVEVADRLAGLRRGANAYLPKPFEPAELLLVLQNLLQLRSNLETRYRNLLDDRAITPSAPPTPDASALDLDIEDAFFQKIRLFIEKNMDNATLGVDELCREAGMSASQLHRKLTALTGLSANRVIRAVRLHHARCLLVEQPALQIAEIGYRTGFTSPSYFARIFQAEVGVSPSEYREKGAR
jgi:signal transduction histidine kinase/AraC-like DNA-binding protein/ligand-binding sensor domain-containing protein/ActR/RegA family two-component response regulator